MFYHNRIIVIFVLICSSLNFSCANVGESTQEVGLGSLATITGSISNYSGTQGDMEGWVVLLIDVDTGIARSGTINSQGQYSFKGVYSGLTYTLALLSPSLVLRAVLSQPVEGGLKMYFKLNGQSSIPLLIHNGPGLYWQDYDEIKLMGATFPDSDSDGVPEEVLKSLTSVDLSLTNKTGNDDKAFDLTMTSTRSSRDIDGDGLINILDHNIDGDSSSVGTLFNEFDSDSNGDASNDILQKATGAYFSRGVDWAVVNYHIIPSSSSGSNRSIFFGIKIKSENLANVKSVSIKRLPSLPVLEEATILSASGEASDEAWNGKLLDNGKNDDGASEDGLYGRSVSLKSGSVPLSNQVIIFEVKYSSWTQEFIYVFPPITPVEPEPTYSSLDRSVIFNGETTPPFGAQLSFQWIVKVYNVDSEDNSTIVYSSQALAGTAALFILPDNIIETDKTYTYKVIAQTQEKVPGYSVFNSHSELMDIE